MRKNYLLPEKAEYRAPAPAVKEPLAPPAEAPDAPWLHKPTVVINEHAHGDDHVTGAVTELPRLRLIEGDSGHRKRFPMAEGLLDYFPDALAAVAEVSYHGNQKHNPGQPLHWARGKSMDHPDCILRHLSERGGFDGPIRHSAALAWRALALLQEELEAAYKLGAPRNAR